MNTEIERALRESHCDERGANHPCRGIIVINAEGVTLACKLCGTEKFLHRDEPTTNLMRIKRADFYRAVLREISEGTK